MSSTLSLYSADGLAIFSKFLAFFSVPSQAAIQAGPSLALAKAISLITVIGDPIEHACIVIGNQQRAVRQLGKVDGTPPDLAIIA